MQAEGQTRLAVSNPLSHVRIAFSNSRVAFPGDNNSISVWDVAAEKRLVAKLPGHVAEVTAICFGEGQLAQRLFSCSEKDTFAWDLDTQSGTKLNVPAGPAVYLAVSITALLCTCSGRSLLLHDTTSNTRAGKLDGHSSAVSGCVFSPADPNVLISISEDRTFMVWDCGAQTMLYRSFVLASLPLLSIAVSPHVPRAAIGDAGGGIHVIDLARGDYRVLHTHALGPAFRGETALSTPQPPGPPSASGAASKRGAAEAGGSGEVEGGAAVVGLAMFVAPIAEATEAAAAAAAVVRTTALAAPLHTCIRLVACSPSAALLIDPHTHRVEARVALAGPDSSSGLPFMASHYFAPSRDGQSLACVSCAAFEPAVYLWSLTLPPPTCPAAAAIAQPTPEPVSVLSTAAPLDDSPLLAKLSAASRPKTDPAAAMRARATQQPGKQGKIVDKPLTFNTKIKSSGYGSAPPRKMFQPVTRQPARRPTEPTIASQSLRGGLAEYPISSPPPCTPGRERVGLGAPVTSLAFSSDGRYLAAGIADKSVQVVRYPFGGSAPGGVRAFVGHTGTLNSVDFSNDGAYLLTSATDNTARVWHAAKGEVVLSVERQQHNRSLVREGEPPNPLHKAITRAQFFYLDRFVLLASLHHLFLYSYAIDATVDDVKRYLSTSRYHLAASVCQPGPSSITTFAAANGFLSHIVLCAGSDKSVCAMDLNASRPARILPDVHRRPATHIALNSGSAFVTHPAAAYDLFLTTAVGDGTNMWDLRAERCVRRFDAHTARQPVAAAFSPCGRFVACGSEDRAVYLYDIRTGSVLQKLGGHTDVACHVAFCPSTPALVSGSADGFLREFAP